MKRINSFIIGVIFLASAVTPAIALTATPRPPNGAILTQAAKQKERMEELKDKMEQRVASREAKLDERKKEIVVRILAHAKRMLDRSKDFVTTLDGIMTRVQSRITKVQSEGIDTSSLSDEIAAVATKKQEALTAIDSANAALTQLSGSNQPKEAVQTFLSEYAKVKTSIRAYHQSIVTVITQLQKLRPARASGTPAALPTVAPTSTPSISATATP